MGTSISPRPLPARSAYRPEGRLYPPGRSPLRDGVEPEARITSLTRPCGSRAGRIDIFTPRVCSLMRSYAGHTFIRKEFVRGSNRRGFDKGTKKGGC